MKKYILILTIIFASCNLYAQTNGNFRQIRFFPVVTASDTAEVSANNGRMWFDHNTQTLRGIKNATAYTIGEGGGGGGPLTINEQTTSYQLQLTDAENTLIIMDVTGANNLTVPDNGTVAFPIGTAISVESITDQTTIVAGPGVTINSSAGNLLSPGDYVPFVLVKTDTDTWDLWNGSPAIPDLITGSLTATRVPFASGTNTLTDDSDLTFSTANNTLTAGRLVGVPTATLEGLNVGSFAGVPSGTTVGAISYNSSLGNLVIHNATGPGRAIINGAIGVNRVPFASNSTGGMSGVAGFTFNTTGDILTVGSLSALTTTTTPALNIGGFAGNPSSLSNGSIWQNSSTNSINSRINGTTVQYFNNGITFGTTPFVLNTSGSNQSLTIGASNFLATISATENISFDGELYIIDTGSESLTFSNAVANQYLVSPTAGSDLILSSGGGSGDDIQIGVTSSAGSVILETSNSSTGTLKLNDGDNEQMGVSTLVGGTVTVNNTKVTANSRIFLTHRTTGGTIGILTYTIVASTSFTITSSSALDTSTVNWLIIEPN